MRYKVPTSGRVLVVIEPTAEDKVRGNAHERTLKKNRQLMHENAMKTELT